MGLFDLFAKKGPAAIRKHAARVANKRAQNPDRWESIQALAVMRTAESAEALLGRFTIRIDPSIIDQEEKEAAFEGIVETGAAAVEPVKKFLRMSEHISWPVKILEKLLTSEEVVSELIALLETMHTEYERDPDRKIQLVAYLEEKKDPRIVPAVRRFLDDMNETVRFHAVSVVLSQPEIELVKDDLLDLIPKEESVRIRARILEGWRTLGWTIPEERRAAIRPRLPEGWALDRNGAVTH